jgi:hypothetical protein
MRAEIRCLICGHSGYCRSIDIDGNGIEANDDDLAEICEHLAGSNPQYAGTGRVECDD